MSSEIMIEELQNQIKDLQQALDKAYKRIENLECSLKYIYQKSIVSDSEDS